jgi:hypothetical protein
MQMSKLNGFKEKRCGNYVMEVFIALSYEDCTRVPSFVKVPSFSQKWEVLESLFQ